MKKWSILTGYVLISALLFLNRKPLSAWLQADIDAWPQVMAVIGTAFLIALVPAIPYGIAAVIVGAKYGPFAGSLINLGVAVSAAAALFFLVRYTLTPDQRRIASQTRGVAKLTSLFERSPFTAVLLARLLPIVPAQAVNFYAAMTRMGWLPYIAATAVGKVPFLLGVTVLGDRLVSIFFLTFAMPS